jgi:hypothetical protein
MQDEQPSEPTEATYEHLPVWVLRHNVIGTFEQVAERKGYSMKGAVGRGIINPQIDWCCDYGKPRGPFVDLETKTICLHESYLAFLWAMIYSSFVIYEQSIQQRILDQTYVGVIEYNTDVLIRARLLGDWAEHFAGRYVPWDERELPNPRTHRDAQEKSLVEKVNGMFLQAVTYLLCHELAHLSERHFETMDDAEQLEQEKQADNFALSFFADWATSETERQIAGAALVLLTTSSLFLAAEFRQIWKRRHPHSHDRIRHAISGLNLQSQAAKDYVYYLASIRLREFLTRHELAPEVQPEDTAEDLFFRYLDRCDEILAAREPAVS